MPYRLFLPMLVTVLCLASGCVRMPQPQGFPYSNQPKMQAAHHWNVLANDVANRINNELIRRNYLDSALHVRHSCTKPDGCGPGSASPFDEGFNDLLTTQLVHFGIDTRAAADGASLIVDYKVQVVHHRAGRSQWPQPGVLTALATGVTVLRDAPWELITIASAAAVDTLRATSALNEHDEVIITTSIMDGDRYLLRTSDIYYINDADSWQYRQPAPAAEIRLTGGHAVPVAAEPPAPSL
ncbi:MAG: hypothetical protein RBS95_09270 [Desulfobulbus sp.]|nr:hypothetical protein [Desulfobulbus sp.]